MFAWPELEPRRRGHQAATQE